MKGGDRDSVGFFQMRVGIWNHGKYAGYPDKPELQLEWFVDQALAAGKKRAAAGIDGKDSSKWGVPRAIPAAARRGASCSVPDGSSTTLPRVRLLVTGGAGFIGSAFVKRAVARGDDVVVLDKLTYSGNRENLAGADCSFVQGDIADPDAVEKAARGCTAVVNFAAESHVDRSILGPAEFIQTDVYGTHVLLEWARANQARYVQVSTDEVYGDLPPGTASSEGDPLRPSSPYSASKAGGDLQVLAYVRTYGVNASISRGANTYGPYQHPEKLVPLFVTNAIDGEPMPVYGDGRQRREWLYVDDHCAGVEHVLAEGAPGEVYNVPGEERENLDVTERILELTGADRSLIRHVEDRPGHDRRYALDGSKLRGLGWQPTQKFDEGLAATVSWYRENRAWWEAIKAGEYREYYERQYGARLA
jgi:dTDP-glucose 4,6-dehydratase